MITHHLSKSIINSINYYYYLLYTSFLHANVGKIFEYIICYTQNKNNSFPFSVDKTTEGKKYPLNNAGNSISILTFPEYSVEFNLPDQTIQPQDMSEGKIITEGRSTSIAGEDETPGRVGLDRWFPS